MTYKFDEVEQPASYFTIVSPEVDEPRDGGAQENDIRCDRKGRLLKGKSKIKARLCTAVARSRAKRGIAMEKSARIHCKERFKKIGVYSNDLWRQQIQY